MATKGQRLRIKREFSAEKPTVWIGKNGITKEAVGEVSKQLEIREVVKVKVLKSPLKVKSAAEIAKRLAKETDSILIEVRGHSLILFRKRRP